MVTTSDDKTALVWNAETGELEHELTDHDQAVLCAAFSGDGKWVITGSDDNRALIWDISLASGVNCQAMTGRWDSLCLPKTVRIAPSRDVLRRRTARANVFRFESSCPDC